MLKFPGPPRIPSSGMFKFVLIGTYDFLDMANMLGVQRMVVSRGGQKKSPWPKIVDVRKKADKELFCLLLGTSKLNPKEHRP